MKYKSLLLVVLAIVIVMSGCIGSPNTAKGTPLITATKSNDTVTVLLVDLNGAKNMTGLHVDSPAIASPDVIAAGKEVPVGKTITITDPALAGKVSIVISSTVDGNKTVVMNGTV
jgi:hypothetical protein